ncbi:phosphatase PAP2 family protein [Danxiaibacter flavus]|uniref:Phosphatase PAP2 family protein n=1 Tax=Danxiaibacter flavus TaxID=3049108 RepID=A0ABV3ZIP1_9BACT|nr:phosphatase PAP2 family protein [Chitinophagaceae bacterium DXS]
MKKLLYIIPILAITSASIVVSCSKNAEGRTDNLPPLQASDQDLNAGTWKTVLIAAPDVVNVPVPAPITTPNYIAELNEIKSYQKNLTGAQDASMKYWNAGGVLRWNEIMRTLVAKYNLPPYQKADGTYPIPSAANPFAYPLFPFANPPYAARAYAYVSAAQYDALVACWHYKQLYKRAAPYKTDSTIEAKAGKSDLPSYPSEAAVLAGVTAEMMKLLFPTEIGFVEQKAVEQETAAIMSGNATRSDVQAGDALGRAIAQQFLARGRTDNAGKAVGTPEQWKAFETMCESRGETPWYSLETPKRNPMLPFFGNVKAFLFDSATKVSLLPAPPPSTKGDQMKKETAEVYSYVTHPTRENIRIVHFWADGAGTYTPPGHWDAIAAEDFLEKNFSEVRWARNMALLNMSVMDAGIVCWYTKYYYFNPRPTQMNPSIKTLTGIPNFPSYISGHSTFSGAAAAILAHIVPEKAEKYMSMAQEASMSRLYGGIHYRSDCDAGLAVGKKVGDYAVARAKTDGAE